ncbi:MAG: IS3 family transposase [Solirubrobacteraceae bacterium]
MVLASLRGPKTIAQLCREHDISETLLRRWREQFLAGGAERLAGKRERTEADELRRQVSRSAKAIYQWPKRPPKGHRRPLDDVDKVVLDVAGDNPTDGTRMVAALAARERGEPVNRKRVQRLMREHRLLQPKRSEGRRRRPGHFQVTRPDELWHLDVTSVRVAEHGWCYLNARSTAAQERSPDGP